MTDSPDPVDALADLARLAETLVDADDAFIRDLRDRRIAAGLSTTVVAERMGVSTDTVEVIERYDSNPTLSQLRRYALAIGIAYSHTVAPEHQALPPR